MLTVLSCLAVEHHPAFTLAALVICIAGSIISLRLFARVRRTSAVVKALWLFMAGLIAGGTIWSTHFVAMMGYETPVTLGYAPVPTVASLAIAVAGSTLGFHLAARTVSTAWIEAGGAILGLGIVAMHYTGMAALRLDGHVEWSMPYVIASVVLAMGFGAAATNRIGRPVTMFCKYGGAIGLVLAVVSLHFTAMAAATVVPGPAIGAIGSVISQPVMAIGVASVMTTLLALASAAYLIDLKSSQEAHNRINHLSLHDPLTGLANRTKIAEHLQSIMDGRADDTARAVVAIIGIGRFKEVNDVHGQDFGDRTLKAVAERLKSAQQPGEFVGRFGGDEFLVIKYPVYGRAEAAKFAGEWHSLTVFPFEVDGKEVSLECRLGAAIYPDHGRQPAELTERAGLALQRLKAEGRTHFAIYEPELDEESRRKSSLSVDLRNAIVNDELELHYQAQHHLKTREIIGFEALLRWNHPVHGRVSPATFIPIAEETGLIVKIGEWVLLQACREAASWERAYTVAVNVAPAQLERSDVAGDVARALEETGLASSRLELEITESGIISDQAHVLQLIRQIKKLGVRIAMDDYGTGYSSLSTLQNFPFDKIKIDREFVTDIAGNEQSAAIIRATVILANSLGIPVLAEGAENEEQLALLQESGCEAVQGFYFGRPKTVEQLRAITGFRKEGDAARSLLKKRSDSNSVRAA